MSALGLPRGWSKVLHIAKQLPTSLELYLKRRGIIRFAGVDEAGRGPIAGPVVACACVVPPNVSFKGLADSKALSDTTRFRLFHEMTECPGLEYAIAVVGHDVIDRINILQASLQAMYEAILALQSAPEAVIVDGPYLPRGLMIPALAVIRADEHCPSVSAASVLAKCTRDTMMQDYDRQWPEYGFAQHKGYGTALHLQRLRTFGPCPIHRLTFAPVRELFESVE